MEKNNCQFKVTAIHLKRGLVLNDQFEIFYFGPNQTKFEKYFPRFTDAELYCRQINSQNPHIGFCICSPDGKVMTIPPQKKKAH